MSSKKQKTSSSKAKAPPPEEVTDDSDGEMPMVASFRKAAKQVVSHQKVNTSGGGAEKSRARGMIIELGEQMVAKKGGNGKTAKKLITIGCPQIDENGAGDYVGTNFASILLPSQKPAESDEDDNDGSKSMATKQLIYPNGPETRCRKIDGSLTVSLYAEGLDKSKETDVARMKVGDMVEIYKLEASPGYSVKNDAETLYVNAGGGKILVEGPPLAHVAAAIKKYAGDRQQHAVFWASVAAQGFYDTSRLNDEQKKQAAVLHKWWDTHLADASRGFRSLAAGKEETLASKLLEQSDRLAGHDAAHFAAGHDMVPTEKKHDAPIAPLLLFAGPPCKMAAGDAEPYPVVVETLYKARKDEAVLATMPKSMLAMVCNHIKWHKEGQGGTSFTAFFCGTAFPDVHGAVAALKKDKTADPGLSLGPVLAAEQSMRAYINLASRDPVLTKMFVNELFFGQLSGTIFVKVLPQIHGGDAPVVASDYPIGSRVQLDLKESLENGAAVVTEAFVREHMCDGGETFVCERQFDGETVLKKSEKDLNEEPVKYATHGVQELSCASWKFSMFEAEKFKEAQGPTLVEFRVLFDGVRNVLAENDEARLDEKSGEVAVTAAAKKAGMKVNEFLTTKCLVYAVAADAGVMSDMSD